MLYGVQLPPHLAGIAAHQHGVVTSRQCAAAGISPGRIARAIASARWIRLHHGVYQTLPGRDDWATQVMAASLACGPAAAVSHTSAARVIGLLDPRHPLARDGLIHLAVPTQRHIACPDGVRLHRTVDFESRLAFGTWPSRMSAADTVLDLGATGDLDRVIGLVARGLQLELVTRESLADALARRHSHRHAADLREFLADGVVESPAELRFLRDVHAAHGFPTVREQVVDRVRGFRRVDFQYDDQRVRVEIDGREGHAGWQAQRRDAARDIEAGADGWFTARPGWLDVRQSPCRLAAALTEIFWSRGWEGRPTPCRRRSCPVRALLRPGAKNPAVRPQPPLAPRTAPAGPPAGSGSKGGMRACDMWTLRMYSI